MENPQFVLILIGNPSWSPFKMKGETYWILSFPFQYFCLGIMMKSVNKYIQYSLHYYCIFIFHFIFLFCFIEPENAEKSMIFLYIVYCLSRVWIVGAVESHINPHEFVIYIFHGNWPKNYLENKIRNKKWDLALKNAGSFCLVKNMTSHNKNLVFKRFSVS